MCPNSTRAGTSIQCPVGIADGIANQTQVKSRALVAGTAGPPWSKRGAGRSGCGRGPAVRNTISCIFHFDVGDFLTHPNFSSIVWSLLLFGRHININQESRCHYNLCELSTDYLSSF